LEFSDLLKEVAKGEEERVKVVRLTKIGESGLHVDDLSGNKIGEIVDRGDSKSEDWGDQHLGQVHKRFYVGVGLNYQKDGKPVNDGFGNETDTFEEAKGMVLDFLGKHGYKVEE